MLIRDAEGALYSPPGYLLFVRGGTLFAQRFDRTSTHVTGEALPIPGPDGNPISTAWGVFSVSRNGVLSYVGTGLRNYQLNWYDRQGKSSAVAHPAPYGSIVLSPDETRLAFDRKDGGVWLLELASGVATRLSQGFAGDPVWSPDGRQLVFTEFDGLSGNLYRKVIAGGDREPLFKSAESKYAQQWLSDGSSILFMNPQTTLYRLPVSGDVKPQLLHETAFLKDEFRLSPNERWIAYNSRESGRWEVYLASFPSFGGKRQVSNGGGCQPHWRKDGKELFYLDLQGKLMALDATPNNRSWPAPHGHCSIPHPRKRRDRIIRRDRGRQEIHLGSSCWRGRADHGDAQLGRRTEAVKSVPAFLESGSVIASLAAREGRNCLPPCRCSTTH